jgi:hypothetical protein
MFRPYPRCGCIVCLISEFAIVYQGENMNFLKKLFSGGGGQSGDRGMYFYVQPKACKTIVKVRVDPLNELSRTEDAKGFFVRKLVSGHRCPFQAEVVITFNSSRKVTNTDVTNGTLSSKEDFLAQQQPTTD